MQKWLSVTLWKLQHILLDDIMLMDGKSVTICPGLSDSEF